MMQAPTTVYRDPQHGGYFFMVKSRSEKSLTARFFNVPFIITPKIVVELFRLQKISFKTARESLEKLAKIGRYSPEICAEALISYLNRAFQILKGDKLSFTFNEFS